MEKKVLEVTENIEKMLVTIFDCALKNSQFGGINLLQSINTILQSIKVERSDG